MSILSRLFPRHHPSLPQNDSDSGRRHRRKQLQEARQQYQWTDAMPNLKGVPMAARVPTEDEPSLAWLSLLVEPGLELLENQIAWWLSHFERKALSTDAAAVAKLTEIRARLAKARALKTDDTLDAIATAAEDAALAARHLALEGTDSFDDMLHEFRTVLAKHAPAHTSSVTLHDYKALFQTVPLPAVAQDFMDDESFVRYRIAGPNPMLIRGIDTLPANFPLSAAQYAAVMAEDNLAAALAEHRIYLLDYAELTLLADNPGTSNGTPKFVYAPLALFALRKHDRRMVPVAIQCGQDPGKHGLFFPAAQDTPAGWGWQMAKSVVQVAEGNYHELFVHLARTHLVMEACAVATHRCLAEAHPLNVLLIPHFYGTLFINNAAADSLIAPGGPIDKIFGAEITASQQAAGNDRLGFDFVANMLPHDLAARRVNDAAHLPDYPYRDDALLVWNAIHQWAQDYVALYYSDDAAIRADTELADWCKALIDDGKLKGFVPITGIAQLVDVLTMFIFTASAQHAAVNFPQKTLMSFAPAISGAGWQAAPAQQAGHNETQWLAMQPPLDAAMEQLNVLTLLGSVYYRALGDYRSNDLPYAAWFKHDAVAAPGGPLQRFHTALKQVEATIDARNTTRIPYTYLLPSKIPNSINI